MPSLFGGLQRQAAALPPIQPQAPTRGRGLIGGARPQTNAIGLMERIAMAGQALGGGGTFQSIRRTREEEMRAQTLAEQQRLATIQNQDRLRADLSPADGPNGSGTGAAPSIDQQMAALDDARLRDPAVAAQFAPVVQQRRMAGLMAGRPIEEQLATELAPEDAGKSYASQFADVPLAAGTIRTRGSQALVGAPVVNRYDDRPGVTNPITGVTEYGAPRGATYDEETRRIGANTVEVAPAGQVYRDGQLYVESTAPRPISDADQTAIATADSQITALDTSLGRAAQIAAQIQNGELNLGPMTNAISAGRNLIGQSDQNSLNYDGLLSWAKEARNAILQANTGVQTDQDAIRELDTILSGTRDERIVSAAIDRFTTARTATRGALQRNIDRRQGQAQPQGAPQPQGGASAVAYDGQGNRYVVRGGQWVRE